MAVVKPELNNASYTIHPTARSGQFYIRFCEQKQLEQINTRDDNQKNLALALITHILGLILGDRR